MSALEDIDRLSALLRAANGAIGDITSALVDIEMRATSRAATQTHIIKEKDRTIFNKDQELKKLREVFEEMRIERNIAYAAAQSLEAENALFKEIKAGEKPAPVRGFGTLEGEIEIKDE